MRYGRRRYADIQSEMEQSERELQSCSIEFSHRYTQINTELTKLLQQRSVGLDSEPEALVQEKLSGAPTHVTIPGKIRAGYSRTRIQQPANALNQIESNIGHINSP